MDKRQFSRCVLLVDDDPDDVELCREALVEVETDIDLHAVRDGVEALAFLRREAAYAAAPRPDLILLDLNMPRKGGHQVLAELEVDRGLNSIPVVVLSTSSDEDDIIKAYSMQANCYVTKPVDYEEFVEFVKTIDMFWLHAAQLPPRE